MNELQSEITHRENEIANMKRRIREREAQCDAALVSDFVNKI